ncbi:MAG: hypothetical protein ABSD50_16410 [Smithella sp.]
MQNPKNTEQSIKIETIQPVQPSQNEPEEKYPIPLNGKWILNDDPILIGKNFQTLTNMRYVPGHPEGILGMTKINSSVVDPTYYRTRSGFYFSKTQPIESHTLVQSFNNLGTASAVIDNTTAIPNTGNFSTNLWTDSNDPISGVPNIGMFTDIPGGQICYTNGVDTCIWGGNEMRVSAFETTSAATGNSCITTNPEDYTTQMQNTQTDVNDSTIITSGRNYILVGSVRPLKGIKFYVNSPNSTSSSLTGSYYVGTSWVSMTITDNTSVGGKSLAQTGTVTFPTTVGLAQPRYIDSYFLYWYQFELSAGTASIYHVTLDAPFQDIIDVWDGVKRTVAKAFWYVAPNYGDETTQVLKQDYVDGDTTTYWNVSNGGGTSSTSNCWFIGFTDPTCGLFIAFNQNVFLNTNAGSTMIVQYWNGSAWVNVVNLVDGTASIEAGVPTSLMQGGLVSWQQQSELTTEQKTIINDSDPYYYYRIYFTGAIYSVANGDIRVDYMAGIPSHTTLSSYAFGLLAANRLMLGCDTYGYKNQLIISADSQPQVFNGDDSYTIIFGDEKPLTCGTSIFAQYASNIYNMALIFKQTETWTLVWTQGTNSMEWTRYLISPNIGCPAPRTLKTVSASFENNINATKVIAIWRGDDGIYVSNGQAPLRVSHDIDSVFDPTKPLHVNPDMVAYEASFVDVHNEEYHWLWASGTNTVLDQEFVLDLKTWQWFNINRGTGNNLQFGIEVTDQIGNYYSYGFLDTGYMERLEYGTSFDGLPIACTMTLGDIALSGDMLEETSVTRFDLIALAKNLESNVNLAHTMDGNSNGDTYTLSEATTARFSNVFTDIFSDPAIFHTFSFSTTTSLESKGFEPLACNVLFRKERVRIR